MHRTRVLPEIPLEAGHQVPVNRIHACGAFPTARVVVEPCRHGLRHSTDETVVQEERPETLVRRDTVGAGSKRGQRARLPGRHEELLEAEREQFELAHLADREGRQQPDVRAGCADERRRGEVREVLQGVERRLALADLVEEDQVLRDVHVGVEVEFEVVHDGLRREVAREQVGEFWREAEVQVVDPTELAGTEELVHQVRLARLPRAVEQHRLARRCSFPR